MEFSSIYTIWLREIKRFMKDKTRYLGGLINPIGYFVIMGFGLGGAFSDVVEGGNYMQFILPGIIGMALLFTSIFSAISVIFERQFGFLKEMLVAPISRTSIVIGKVLGSATTAMLNGVVLLLIGIVFGIIPAAQLNPVSILIALVFMLLIASSFVALGLALAAKMNSMEGFQFVMGFLVMPVFLLSGVFFPIANLPDFLQVLAYIDPLMYGIEGLRYALLGTSFISPFIALGALLIFNGLMIAVAARLFKKMSA
ncbi:MAG: ABC transporter permease [Candidatus Iainarchaeum archaeon]|uniref:ABC transporter permease n=1 Tax=Candidatus Iainarchaeum sp. TaxID=3101447 RepID=A0A7T9I264_9ARCH|nr:MAG: ABC transporter permease [Candidatus Diapherotrites archaeon]